ncbi:MAG: hypothetical protein ACP5T4_02365 [Candidatus Micrarchaeia archaeon]
MDQKRTLVLRQLAKPEANSPEEIASAVCKALGISGKEDIKLFREIAEHSLKGEGTTSKALSRKLQMPRSTIIYKLDYFIDNGIVVRKGRQYFLRGSSLEDTFEALEAEMRIEFERLMELASKFDELIESELYGRKRTRQ